MTDDEKKKAAAESIRQAFNNPALGALSGLIGMMPSGVLQDIERAVKTAEVAQRIADCASLGWSDNNDVRTAREELRRALLALRNRLITYATRRSEELEKLS